MKMTDEMINDALRRRMKCALVKNPIMRKPVSKLRVAERMEVENLIRHLIPRINMERFDSVECFQESRLLLTLGELCYRRKSYKEAAEYFSLALFVLEKVEPGFDLSTWFKIDNVLHPETFVNPNQRKKGPREQQAIGQSPDYLKALLAKGWGG